MGQKPIQLNRYTCERCGHEWLPRSEEIPEVCPKCKSPYWNRPKQNPSKQENEKE